MRNEKLGQAAILGVLLVMAVMVAATFGSAAIALRETSIAGENTKSQQSYYAAEAGIDDIVYRIKRGKNVPSNTTMTFNGAAVATTISSPSQNEYLISATGNAAGAIRAVESRLVRGVGVDFPYGAQVGYLGLLMKNRATIQGSVYSNGSIIAEPKTNITGDGWAAGGTALNADQEQATKTTETTIHDTSTTRDGAQGFVPSTKLIARKTSVYVKKVGNPLASLNIWIVPDENGAPAHTTSDAVASGEIKASSITSQFAWIDTALTSELELEAGRKYWLILDASSYDSTKYYVLGASGDTSYAAGTFLRTADWSTRNPPQWNATNKDIMFKIFLGTDDVVIDGASIGGDAHARKIINSEITGTAYCQIGNNNNKPCDTSEPDPSPQDLPLSQAEIDKFKADGSAGGVCGAPTCSSGNYTLDNQRIGSLGPIQIPGNLKVKNRSKLTITGTLYVQGDLEFDNYCGVKLDPSYGSQSGVIIVDGTVLVQNQCDVLGSGDPLSYLMIITTSDRIDDPPAMRVRAHAEGTIFYAQRGSLLIENQVDVREAVGQKLIMENYSELNYEAGISHVQFSLGPTGGWDIDLWKEIVP